MTEKTEVDEIIEACARAFEILHDAILEITATEMEHKTDTRWAMLGIHMALLRHAARVSLIQKKFGQLNTKVAHMNLARSMYADTAEKMRERKKARRKKDKVVPLKVVK